jgi:hypothetical protein
MLSPVLILHFYYSTFEVRFAGNLPILYFPLNVRFARICVTLVVLTRVFPERESSWQRQPVPAQTDLRQSFKALFFKS